MKAILVIDLNDTTLKECDTDVSKCWAKVIVHTSIKGTAHGIGSCVYANDNVELKPMPQRKQSLITVFDDGAMFNEPTEFEQGYNACLDEILGDTE